MAEGVLCRSGSAVRVREALGQLTAPGITQTRIADLRPMSVSSSSSQAARPVAVTLLPVMAAVLTGFLVIGAALPVLPLHVSGDLGFSSVVVGLVAGAQFGAALISRIWSGSYTDAKGGKRAVVIGFVTAAVAGLLYLLSLAFVTMPILSVTILIIGRAVLKGWSGSAAGARSQAPYKSTTT